ncbi:MAG: hypothetical protein VZS44_05880 [Bacilli bacterium]|nr:hypothetical protein [Bacilli bacterium]
MQTIDFMTGKKFIKDEEDIKFIIISPKGDIYLASKKYDEYLMKKDFKLDYYNDNDKCNHHKDYIQVLLNRFFKDNPNYKKYLKNFSSDENLIVTTNVIHQLLNDGYIIFSNLTTYGSMYYLLHGKNGRLFVNYPTITKEQEESLKEIENYLEKFEEITIEKYSNHEKNICNLLYLENNKIYNALFEKKSKTK